MALIKRLAYHFNPEYIRPNNIARAIRQIKPVENLSTSRQAVRDDSCRRIKLERRSGLERRQGNTSVILDLRSPYSRRKSRTRRRYELELGASPTTSGLDEWA